MLLPLCCCRREMHTGQTQNQPEQGHACCRARISTYRLKSDTIVGGVAPGMRLPCPSVRGRTDPMFFVSFRDANLHANRAVRPYQGYDLGPITNSTVPYGGKRREQEAAPFHALSPHLHCLS
jgi:hypothetical protein